MLRFCNDFKVLTDIREQYVSKEGHMVLVDYGREELNVIYFLPEKGSAILSHIISRPLTVALAAAETASSACLHPQSVQLGSLRRCRVRELPLLEVPGTAR